MKSQDDSSNINDYLDKKQDEKDHHSNINSSIVYSFGISSLRLPRDRTENHLYMLWLTLVSGVIWGKVPLVDFFFCLDATSLFCSDYLAALLLLVKCYDFKRVKSLSDLTILTLVGSRSGELKQQSFSAKITPKMGLVPI